MSSHFFVVVLYFFTTIFDIPLLSFKLKITFFSLVLSVDTLGPLFIINLYPGFTFELFVVVFAASTLTGIIPILIAPTAMIKLVDTILLIFLFIITPPLYRYYLR